MGRRTLIYELVQILAGDTFRMINICGPKGIGKSKVTLELLTYVNERDILHDGIVYVDMEGVDTVDSFKERLRIKFIQGNNEAA